MNVGMRPGTRSIQPLTVLAVIILMAAASFAHAQDDIAGKWRTEQQTPSGKIIVIMQFQQDATGRWTGTVKNSRNPEEIGELKSVNVDGSMVTFHTLTDMPGTDNQVRSNFMLRLRPAENKLKGNVNIKIPGMGERDAPIEFSRIVEQAGAEGISFQQNRPVIGAWSARPDDDDKEREVQIEVLADGDDYRGTLTDTGVDETVALRDLLVKDTTVSFNFRFEGAPFMSSFWGRYDSERDRLRGSMSIGGQSQPMTFERTSAGPESLLDEFETEKKPLPRKHESKLAAVGRLSYWVPLYVLKDNVRNINDITSPELNFDVGARWYFIDYISLGVRYARGGLGFDTNEQNLGLFDPVDGPQGEGLSHALTKDSYLKMDGVEFTLNGYLGQSLFPTSRFNPYLTFLAGRTSWELTEGGRGTDIISIFGEPVEGSSWTFGGGLGTEYALGRRLGLEFEWLWSYTMTGDEKKWADTTEQWTSQHVYRFSLGLVWWF
jgi:hypothetical protein